MARTYRKSKYRKKSRDGIQPPRCYDPPCQICFPSKEYNRFLERYKAIQDATYDPEGRCHACAWWVDYHEQGCWADVLTPHCTGCWEPYSYCCCGASEESNYYGGAVWQTLGDNRDLQVFRKRMIKANQPSFHSGGYTGAGLVTVVHDACYWNLPVGVELKDRD